MPPTPWWRPLPIEATLHERYPVWAVVQVRYGDLDTLGHANNAVYLSYLEMGRVAYLRQRLAVDHPGGYSFVVARVEIDYLRPAFLGDLIAVALKPVHVGRSSFTYGYCLYHGETGQPIAQARSVQVYWDARAGRSHPLPDSWRTALEADMARFGIEVDCASLTPTSTS
ncbi:MAG: acyl-CoA thioesterase [Chloroflexi bacterium]|nr:acyl-CoA thioesterase [Chloroflexota bacterium]